MGSLLLNLGDTIHPDMRCAIANIESKVVALHNALATIGHSPLHVNTHKNVTRGARRC